MTKKMQQNIIFLVIVAFGLGYVYFKYLLSPLQQKQTDALAQLQKQESKLTEMKRRALELPKLQAEMQMLQDEVAGLEKLLPKDKEVSELLRTVTKTAHNYHLSIMSITPQPLISQSNYNEIPFQMTVLGNYHAIANFLAEIGQDSRILSSRNINFTSMPATKDNLATVSANFVLVAYTFKTQ
jgi:type IV pilus assembly protein PilO